MIGWKRGQCATAFFLTFALTYLCSVASDDHAEIVYAFLFSAGATTLVLALHSADHRSFAPRARALAIIAARAASGAWSETCLLLGPRLFAQLRGRAPDGRFVRVRIDVSGEDARDMGRIGLTLWASSLTPNALPLFIDRGQLVFHQLVPRREPHADDPEFPV